ncbi:hypothetical protein FHS55_000183 [Angulomicrobium tetraedrale]|uniref:Uncharacterized protein n=1 Tax=Ancylobacter tetraedralis TaxID=217068 RepID=A0A839Z8A9_9HYPH|nr:hypothetical protein [Ancylobacter tetraedralis]MBB3769597.1 hypothetical protein [Ancylobacter tetraedralis]
MSPGSPLSTVSAALFGMTLGVAGLAGSWRAVQLATDLPRQVAGAIERTASPYNAVRHGGLERLDRRAFASLRP